MPSSKQSTTGTLAMIRSIWAITVVTYKESMRNRLFYAILILAIILSLLNVSVGTLFNWELGKVSVEFGLSVTALTGLLLLFYQAMKVFVDDLEQRTIYLTLSRPVSYAQFVIGKFSGLSLILLLVIVIFSLTSALSLLYFIIYYPAYIPINFSWSTYFLAYFFKWIVLLIVLAMSLFWFAFARQPVVAIIISFISYLVGNTLYLVRQYIEINEAETGSLQLNIVKVITWLFPDLTLFDLKFIAAYGLPYSHIHLTMIMIYALSMIALFLSLAIFFFKRKELQ